MYDVFVKKEQSGSEAELKKSLNEKLCSLKRRADGIASCFTVHECRRIDGEKRIH